MRACCGPAWEAVSAPRLAGSLRGQGAVHDEAEGAGTPARSELFWVRVSRGDARGGGCTWHRQQQPASSGRIRAAARRQASATTHRPDDTTLTSHMQVKRWQGE